MKNTKMHAQSVDIYKTVKRIRVEDDSTLPDYCSDIMRVVRIEGIPTVRSKKVYLKDDALICEVSGTVLFNVVYLTDNGMTECHNFTADYYDTSKAEASDIDPDTVCAFVTPTVDNVVCKVQSPRRISVRAELNLSVDAKGNTAFEYYSPTESDRVETASTQCLSLKVASCKDQEFRVSEEIKLPKSMPPMERILSNDLTLAIEDARAGDNLVSFWGNAGISCIYLPEDEGDSRIESFYQPLEIKGSIEVDESRGDMAARVEAVPSRIECEILSDDLGENRVLKVDFTYTAECTVQENTPIELTEDIYGVGCKALASFDKREVKKYVGTLRETTGIKERIPMKKGIIGAEGGAVRIIPGNIYFEGGELFADSKVQFSAIGITEDSRCAVSESFDVKVKLNPPSEVSSMGSSLCVDLVQSAGFADVKVADGEAIVSFDISTVADTYYTADVQFVSSVDIEDTVSDNSLTVFYYPDESDDLWSVGKRYGVSRAALAQANSITDGSLKRVMIIPTV